MQLRMFRSINSDGSESVVIADSLKRAAEISSSCDTIELVADPRQLITDPSIFDKYSEFPDYEKFAMEAAECLGYTLEILRKPNRQWEFVRARRAIAYVMILRGHSTVVTGKMLNMDHSGITDTVKKAKSLLSYERDERLSDAIEAIIDL